MSDQIKEMFSTIAKHYDTVNHKLSFGADIRWRKKAAAECCALARDRISVVDVATGTGDLTIAICEEAKRRNKSVEVLGMDFNEDMLSIAKQKVQEQGLTNVTFRVADVLVPTSPDNSYDIVTCGFALRNFDSLEKFVQESHRVLRPGGKIVFLEVARPTGAMSAFYKLYYFRIVPTIAAKYNSNAYQYLIDSLWKFDKNRLFKMVQEAGFKDVKLRNLSFGAAFILTATK